MTEKMVITELYIKNFGMLSEKHIRFTDGVQVICGEKNQGNLRSTDLSGLSFLVWNGGGEKLRRKMTLPAMSHGKTREIMPGFCGFCAEENSFVWKEILTGIQSGLL